MGMEELEERLSSNVKSVVEYDLLYYISILVLVVLY